MKLSTGQLMTSLLNSGSGGFSTIIDKWYIIMATTVGNIKDQAIV
jgi:hypothetical protein